MNFKNKNLFQELKESVISLKVTSLSQYIPDMPIFGENKTKFNIIPGPKHEVNFFSPFCDFLQ